MLSCFVLVVYELYVSQLKNGICDIDQAVTVDAENQIKMYLYRTFHKPLLQHVSEKTLA